MVGLFVGVHTALAIKLDAPELMVPEDEAKAFMKAAQQVARHYSVETTQKSLDWIAFIGSFAAIYTPRIMAVGVRRQREREAAAHPPAPPPFQIYPEQPA